MSCNCLGKYQMGGKNKEINKKDKHCSTGHRTRRSQPSFYRGMLQVMLFLTWITFSLNPAETLEPKYKLAMSLRCKLMRCDTEERLGRRVRVTPLKPQGIFWGSRYFFSWSQPYNFKEKDPCWTKCKTSTDLKDYNMNLVTVIFKQNVKTTYLTIAGKNIYLSFFQWGAVKQRNIPA